MASALAVPSASRRRDPDGELAVKLRVAHLVASADLEPGEVPPAAILIVRRMADPLPRGLSAGPSPLAAAPAWERAARTALGEIAHTAVRPARGVVPSHANAVLFADQAELLSCFSRDFLRGEAAFFWWWRAILRSLPRSLPSAGSRAVYELWIQNVRYLPAVVTKLTEVGDIVWVLRSFTPHQARTMLQEITRIFDLPDVLGVESHPWLPQQLNARPDKLGDVAATVNDWRLDVQATPTALPPPWLPPREVQELSAELSREHCALLVVSLALCQSPALVRRSDFAAHFDRWWRAPSGVSAQESKSPSQQPRPLPISVTAANVDLRCENSPKLSPETSVEAAFSADQILAPSAATPTKISVTANSAGVFAAEATAQLPPGAIAQFAAPHPTESAESKIVTPIVRESKPDATPPAPSHVEPSEQPSDATGSPQEHRPHIDMEAALRAGDSIVTNLGGIFFLITLMKLLDIPYLLEREWSCELGLSAWECLDLIARCLVGAHRTDLANDPVWRLLALLDGRAPEQSPGQGFRPPSSYRLPEAWLSKQPTLADNAPDRVPPLGLSPLPPLQSFLDFLMPVVRWRLASGLGLSSQAEPDFTHLLLSRSAKVWMTTTHIDIVMPMDQLTVAVRAAGLDTDPGWVPSFGRIVKFHYQ